jgi:hypothetical protein
MKTIWIRRFTFGTAGVWMFWLAAQAYAHAGNVTDTAFDAALGAMMLVLAITAKGG